MTRRALLYTLLSFFMLCGVRPVAEGNGAWTDFCDQVRPCQLLVQLDAEKMLGQSVRRFQDTSELRGDVRQCVCAYKGMTVDKATGQDCVLYFSLEQREKNASAEQAHQVLASTKTANEHDTLIRDLDGIGDEAFLLSNDSNSHLIMARKGVIIVRLQIKRAAEEDSAEQIKAFARKVSKLF